MSEILNDELESMFVQPGRVFKNKPLAPYTEGSRLLLMQVRDDEDSHIFFVWAFIFLHILLLENRQKAVALAWDKAKFRQEVLDFLNDQTQLDCDSATQIVTAMVNEASNAKVKVVSSGAGGDSGKA